VRIFYIKFYIAAYYRVQSTAFQFNFKRFHFFFRDENPYYGIATVVCIIVPFLLILTFGKGLQEMKKVATHQPKRYSYLWRKNNDSSNLPCWAKTILTIWTFLTFLPGLSWIPSPVALFMEEDASYRQSLLTRKKFELFGENAPQFILQLAIEIIKPDTDITSAYGLIRTIFTNFTIASSLFGLIMRSTTVYLELDSKDKHDSKVESYTSWKDKSIVAPTMFITITPRVLALAVLLGSSFPLLLQLRFGMVMFLGTFVFYGFVFGIVGYVNAVKPGKVDMSEMVLSGLSALIAPCLVFHQTSKLLLWSSVLTSAKYIVLMFTMLTVLKIEPSIWNQRNDPAGNYFIIILTTYIV
jgi:hypothetical protein